MPSASWLLLFYYGVCLFLMAYSAALVASMLYVYFRDLKHLTSIVLQIWFYATPVVYDESMVPSKYRWILFANPLGNLFSGVHRLLTGGSVPEARSVLAVGVWAAIFVLTAILAYKGLKREIVERI